MVKSKKKKHEQGSANLGNPLERLNYRHTTIPSPPTIFQPCVFLSPVCWLTLVSKINKCILLFLSLLPPFFVCSLVHLFNSSILLFLPYLSSLYLPLTNLHSSNFWGVCLCMYVALQPPPHTPPPQKNEAKYGQYNSTWKGAIKT